MRGLHPDFLQDLQEGRLQALLERAQLDRTLALELRDDALKLYYRGGSLLHLRRVRGDYDAHFDLRYAKGQALTLPPSGIVDAEGLQRWIEALPRLKERMDLWFGRHPKEEREIQQLIARDNNLGPVGRSTDYFVCDIEYANPHGRFDLVALHWPSTGPERKRSAGRRLVIGEVKQGDQAVDGKAGLHAHVRDVDAFLSDPARVGALKAEMREVFNQKRALGLINAGRDLHGFGDEAPLLLLILVNHDPESARLRRALETLPEPERCEARIATASLMGYGLYDPWIRTVEEALALPEAVL